MSVEKYWPGPMTWAQIVERIRSWSDSPVISRDEAYEVAQVAGMLGIFGFPEGSTFSESEKEMSTTTAPTEQVATTEEKRLECTTGQHNRMLAKANARGLLLWCREHNRSHLVTWEDLAYLRESFAPIPCKDAASSVYSE